ncbi:MAG: pilus assembly protein PilY [Proteobacteria bacterium]|nr:pilus assembly protein PilY [Pseudomonadota bacterium]
MSSIIFSRSLARSLSVLLLLPLSLAPVVSLADSTDIAVEPLITMADVSAKPNIMFILDNSGSMASAYMPDEQGSSTSRYGYWSSQCNGVAYNPNITYKAPSTSAGGVYTDAVFGAAYSDGYVPSGSPSDLQYSGDTVTIGTSSSIAPATGSKTFTINSSSNMTATSFAVGVTVVIANGSNSMTGTVTSWTYTSSSNAKLIVNVTSATGSSSKNSWTVNPSPYYYTYSGTEAAMSWKYDSVGDVDTSTTFYKQCKSSIGGTDGKNVFTKVYVSANSTEATNYANWYSFYRTRRLLIRTAAGRAFVGLGSGYRVGFTTISESGITPGTYFRDVKAFDETHKADFYTSLYEATGRSATPLRASLSKVGRYFAKQISGQTYDPMEYSCQRNFAILSTDGYWNTGSEGGDYIPVQLDGSTAPGNQDGTEDRPMYDGSTVISIRTRNKYSVVKGTGTFFGNGCSSSTYKVTTTLQTYSAASSSWVNGTSGYTCEAATYIVYGTSTASALSGKSAIYSSETSTPGTTGGSSNTLADVAEYYYKTDLRTSALGNCTSSTSGSDQDVCSNSVVPTGRDLQTQQHLTTFTIGLGVSGTLTYDKNYLTQASGSYVDVTNGPSNWPVPVETDTGGDARQIDDLWHAAVNGRGQYYSALNAEELSSAISGVVTSIQETTGSASSASTNTLELVKGSSNRVYQASYTTANWVGDLKAYSIDGTTAEIGSTAIWSAQSKLDGVTPSSRTIYFNKGGTLTSFVYGNLASPAQTAYFDNFCSMSVVASQCPGLTTANLALANSGNNLVDYLRGVRANETTLYRARTHVLGDIINSTPVYVGAPLFSYVDAGYADFKTSQASRTPIIYTGANDGMLHAFDTSGNEVWAFVPTAVMPNLYKLADASYASRHVYFADGTPVVGDIYVGGAWKTILVAGLNSGGKAYYALDITTPESPTLLWEFTDTNLGLTYGNPIIAKRADGTWVVAFASGYNNTGGDGKGHLYVLNANTGAEIMNISTGVGSSASPSGLAKINAWIADSSDNTALRYYGGDLQGNLWRFDLDDLVLPHKSAFKLAEFTGSDGKAPSATIGQPISVVPRLKQIAGYPVVIVGTGRYLGTTDISDKAVQSLAVIKDPLTDSGWGVVRDNVTMVKQTLTVSGTTATSTSNAVDWSVKNGWWFDFPSTGERLVTPMALAGNTLYAASAIPSGTACTSGGASWIYTINLLDGSSTGMMYSDSALIVGITAVSADGKNVLLVKDSTGNTKPTPGGDGGGGGGTAVHRTSWRELID